MDHGFRIALRSALVLTIAIGVGLIVYAFHEYDPPRMETTEMENGTSSEPATETEDGSGAAERPGVAERETPPASPADPGAGMEMTVQNFSQSIQDPDGKIAATLSGPTATNREGVWQISEPLLLAKLALAETEGTGEEHEQVRLAARQATWQQGEGIVQLNKDVTAQNENLWISVDRVTYRAARHTLHSDSHVRMRRDRVDAQGASWPAILLSGDGLEVNLPVREVTIRANVETRLYHVSRDFLAGQATEADPAEGDAGNEVVIKSKGKAVYESLTRRVTYNEGVTVEFGGKTLACDRLSVQLDRKEGKDNLEVTDIVASGNVSLSQQEQTLSGQELEWHNVTQGGVLRGNPATAETPQFHIRGDELTFYRLNDRFQSKGPGRLLWKGTEQPAEEAGEETADDGWPRGPFRLRKDAAVSIRWQTSMTYAVSAGSATFQDKVRVEQGQSALSCSNLTVEFDRDAGEITRLVAEGEVGFADEPTGAIREVFCQRLAWDANANSIELAAAEGESVQISAGQQQITAPRVVFDNSTQALRCPRGGHLAVRDEQGEPDGRQAPVVMDVRWEGPMEFRRGQPTTAKFQDAVHATREEQSIKADSLEVKFDENTDPTLITATGSAVLEVTLRPPEQGSAPPPAEAEEAPVMPTVAPEEGDVWRLSSETLVIDPAGRTVRSPAAGELVLLHKDAPSGGIRWQEEMKLDSSAGEAEFQGDVVAEVDGSTLNSRTLSIDFDPAGRIQHVSAREGVVFTAGLELPWRVESESAEAVFTADNDLKQVIARGDVRITRPSHALHADRVQIFLARAEGQQEPAVSRAIAEENVWVSYTEQEESIEAGGDRLEWDLEDGTYVLTGDPNCYVHRGGVRMENWKIVVDPTSGRASAPPGERLTTTRADEAG